MLDYLILLLPVALPVAFWVAYYLHVDRHLPEPKGHLVLAFALGGVSFYLGLLLYRLLGVFGLRYDAFTLAGESLPNSLNITFKRLPKLAGNLDGSLLAMQFQAYCFQVKLYRFCFPHKIIFNGRVYLVAVLFKPVEVIIILGNKVRDACFQRIKAACNVDGHRAPCPFK